MKVKQWIVNTGKGKFIVSAPTKKLALLNFKYENLKEYARSDFVKISKKRKL